MTKKELPVENIRYMWNKEIVLHLSIFIFGMKLDKYLGSFNHRGININLNPPWSSRNRIHQHRSISTDGRLFHMVKLSFGKYSNEVSINDVQTIRCRANWKEFDCLFRRHLSNYSDFNKNLAYGYFDTYFRIWVRFLFFDEREYLTEFFNLESRGREW